MNIERSWIFLLQTLWRKAKLLFIAEGKAYFVTCKVHSGGALKNL